MGEQEFEVEERVIHIYTYKVKAYNRYEAVQKCDAVLGHKAKLETEFKVKLIDKEKK